MKTLVNLAVSRALKYSKPSTIDSNIRVDEEYLRRVVEALSFERVYGSMENLRAKEIVQAEFQPTDMPIAVDMPYRNICVGYPKLAKILIGAHYDSVPHSPGADDNASAVAVMLAVAKAVGYNENVCFVAFNSEEYGLRGSYDFVKNLGTNRIQQAHILEMVGFTNKNPGSQRNPLPFIKGLTDVGDFLGLVGNDRGLIGKIVDSAGTMDVPAIGVGIPKMVKTDFVAKYAPDLLRSDHTSFWEANIPAVMWTDTSNFRNPNYHRPTDTPDTLDYHFMAEVAKLLIYLCGKG